MKIEIGDLFYYDVAYDDNPSEYKNRPVLLLAEDENDILLLISTTSNGRNNPLRWYDHYKIPIQNWRKTGLQNASWCRGKVLISVPRTEVDSTVKSDDYIGRMYPEDFNVIIDKIEKLHG